MIQNPADLPLALYRAEQTRALDAWLIAAGTPGFVLMQRAALAAWQQLQQRWPEVRPVTVLAGVGNNAGDGLLLATLAHQAGWPVRVLAVGDPARLQGDAARARDEALAAGVPLLPWRPDQVLEGILVDALLGTGLSGAVRPPFADAIRAINASGLPVLAIDLPSGLSADTGQVLGVAVRATLTVTFIGLKLGLLTGEGPELAGVLVFAALGAGAQARAAVAPEALRLAGAALPVLPPRPRQAHKGLFGLLLVIGGDLGTGGAALMAAEAGLRCGAGMVGLATRPEHVLASLVRCPEIMCHGLESSFALESLRQRATVLVVGPGLGQRAWGRSLLGLAARCPVPQVWDADALNLLAEGVACLPGQAIITPHPGEAARLLGSSIAEVQQDRPAAARALARRFDCVAVLKGAGTLVAAPDGQLALCDRGHPAMASAGLGDVRAGLLGALLAQGLSPFAAACLGVWLHARAGEQAGQEGRGLLATELIPLARQLLEAHSPCLG